VSSSRFAVEEIEVVTVIELEVLDSFFRGFRPSMESVWEVEADLAKKPSRSLPESSASWSAGCTGGHHSVRSELVVTK
jgi:hypothetical protein